jgi:hypothetical protein
VGSGIRGLGFRQYGQTLASWILRPSCLSTIGLSLPSSVSHSDACGLCSTCLLNYTILLTLGKSASSLLVKSSLSTAEKGNRSAPCVYLLGLFAQVRYGGCHDYEQIINGAWVVPWASVQGVAFFGPGD